MQIPLRLSLHDDAIFDNFYAGAHVQTIATLKNFVNFNHDPVIFCYGENGVGKTHLLQAACHAFSEKRISFFYFPLSAVPFSKNMFDSLEKQAVVCLDDVDVIARNVSQAETLFHFYNRARDHGVKLLMSAKKPPQQLSMTLRDLQSRFASALVLEIKKLSDAEKIKALQLRAQLRGFSLTDEVAHYLMHHHSRDTHDLFLALEKLDQASLIEKRKLSIPFVKRVVKI
ncbi:MAG: DnaA regulatory inactivator Hda [Gammaproteobacteria bacterium RIFCSPLOWO2_02_FULL_42_14]|nr:MAG: DnaA regulatory inactivator Hda [Gammaproteobacteria bacterium RIFCSPHIGHO2_02_FULL_42_43]OGT51705.1 MAG: DnaA regulatory inactivator Hda [Gammaproteobacteria bacterium RIFCSPHIGHO2_12_FULL_41_25]OGT61602.1 MAG: DnaA regulatory inactivator Hda [Gammaproteobacteria bacterium RIFCSPLOWO2_02_FULL_42_14]OGT86226.1 MAG: DnaA regulatory inactivator Hda [Gammaproteobacteria bacterium RIFCSPLOWO2_12_FULL_42_18]